MEEVHQSQVEFLQAQRLAAIIDSSDDAIISKNLDGIVQTWNKAAESIFGYTAAEMIGETIKRILPPDRLDEEDRILGRLRAGEKVDHFQTIRLTKSGRRIPVSLTISPIRDASGVVVGASKIARDITREKELEKEKESLLENERTLRLEAERANRIKNEFLATLSHELRTPLTAIAGWAQILLMGKTDPETVQRAAEVIDRNTRLQTNLIDELLDLNRLLMGKLRLDIQAVDLCGIVDAVVESFEPTAAAKQIRIRKILDPRAGSVRGDPVRLQQIVWNLLSNALKFTPSKGLVEISLSRVNSHVELSVADNGMGIAPENLSSVFERFFQGDSSTKRRHGGLGLGLAIVKHLAELHGGSVQVKSAGEGAGATFRVHLPFPAAIPRSFSEVHPQHPVHAAAEWTAPNLSGFKVLVVDDDRDASDLVAHILRTLGLAVTQAGCASDGLKLIGEQPFDLLVSDIGMPEMDGFEFIRTLRAHKRNLPAIALTAFGRSEDRRNAMTCGFDLFLSKPIDATELAATVARVLERVRAAKSS